MKNPTIVIVHKLKNRIRIKLSHPLKQVLEDENMIKEHDGINNVRYNPVTKSIVVEFDQFRINVEEVIIRIAIVYSKDYGFAPVNLISNTPKKQLPKLSYYSLITILMALGGKFLKPIDNIQEFLNWLAAGTTIGAIGEHALSEINEKGTVDPEVMSVMYLINSIKKNNFVGGSAITWMTTFGRHILNTSYDEVTVKVSELTNVCNKETYYNVSFMPNESCNNKIGILKDFLSKFIENESKSITSSIVVTKDGINNTQRIYCGFSNGCNSIKANGMLKGINS